MRDHRMMIRADAKAVGIVTATQTRVCEPWRGTTNKQQNNDVKVYNISDPTNVTTRSAHSFRKQNETTRTTTRKRNSALINRLITCADLPPVFAD